MKDFLSRNQVPYEWVDLETDTTTRELIRAMPDGMARLPVLLFGDGTTMVQPTFVELADKLGMQTHPKDPVSFYQLVVVGGGPAGLAAALYGASEGLRTLLIERDAPGGQAGTSSQIENYLGFPNGVRDPISRGGRPFKLGGSAPRLSRLRTSWRFAVAIRTASPCWPTARRSPRMPS